MASSLEYPVDIPSAKQGMHKIFYIPEILDEIFSYSSKHTQTVLARVCQMWFTRSILLVWDRVKLNDALSVLSPFTAGDGGFERPLSPDAWKRFFQYSRNVRFLECSDINHTALTQAALYRPSSTDLFSSKLAIVTWKGVEKHVNCLFPLLSPTIRVLFISLDTLINADVVDALCKTIVFRSPLLCALEITIPPILDHTLQITCSLSRLMSLLPHLVSVSIPIHFTTPESFTALSRLPRLESILLSSTLSTLYAEELLERKTIICEESEEVLPFSSLGYLYIFDVSGSQAFATTLSQGIQLFALVRLSCSPWCESSDQIIALMESVKVVCPNLESMSLSGENCPSGRLPWEAIRALLQCKELDTLEVVFSTVDMVLEDMVTVATNRIFWKVVVLPSTAPLSYQALVTFAQNCPKLTELGLTLNNDSEFPDLEPDVWFSSLTTLDVGNSLVASQLEVGIFMSSICPNSLVIDADDISAPSWKAVEKLVNSINKSAQVRVLNKEIAAQAKEIAFLRTSCISERTLHSISIQTLENVPGASKSPVIEPESILN